MSKSSSRSENTIWIALSVLLGFVLRLIWIEDISFKGDAPISISQLAHPLALFPPVESYSHAGVAHSNGALILLKFFAFGSLNPAVIAGISGFLNWLALALGIWLCIKSKKGILTFLMCATSFSLVFGCRGIEAAYMVAVWIYLFFGFFIYSQTNSTYQNKDHLVRKRVALAISGFSVLLAGQMYMPGFLIGIFTFLCIAAFFISTRRNKEALFWIGGCGLGLLTWLPYFYNVFYSPSHVFQSNALILRRVMKGLSNWSEIKYLFEYAILLVSPFASENNYILRTFAYLAYLPRSPFLRPLLLVLGISKTVWTVIFIWALSIIYTQRIKSLRDPLIVASVGLLCTFVFAIQILGTGNYPNYWLGVVPFAYYIVGWSCTSNSKSALRLTRITLFGVSSSVLSVVLFLLLVRQVGGIPGDYGVSYRVQKENHRGSDEWTEASDKAKEPQTQQEDPGILPDNKGICEDTSKSGLSSYLIPALRVNFCAALPENTNTDYHATFSRRWKRQSNEDSLSTRFSFCRNFKKQFLYDWILPPSVWVSHNSTSQHTPVFTRRSDLTQSTDAQAWQTPDKLLWYEAKKMTNGSAPEMSHSEAVQFCKARGLRLPLLEEFARLRHWEDLELSRQTQNVPPQSFDFQHAFWSSVSLNDPSTATIFDGRVGYFYWSGREQRNAVVCIQCQ